jgi:hypothetical protein
VDVTQWVQQIRAVAQAEQVPLIEYYEEITTRRPNYPGDPTNGEWNGTLLVLNDRHPSNTAPTRDFSETMLSLNGYTLRNYTTLLKMHEVFTEVLEAPPWTALDIVYDVAYLGNDTYGYTFSIDGHDGQLASYFANMTFEGVNGGQVQQMQVNLKDKLSLDVDSNEDADMYHGLGSPPYDKHRDSYFMEPFPSNAVALDQDVNYYHIEAGTGGGSAYEDMDLAYIVVSNGGDLHYEGVISRQAVNYDVDGFLTAPVPGDATLDDAVDGADYTIWADNYLQTDVGWVGADFNGDGVVDGADYTIWADFYSGGKGPGPVPEPLTLAVLAAGSGLVLRRRR